MDPRREVITGMGVKVGGVEFYTGPAGLGALDDLDGVIREFIDKAKTSLQVAVQELDSRAIADSLLAAQAAGVRVEVVLESDYLTESTQPEDPWKPVGDHEDNRVIHDALLRAGIQVRTDLNPAIFHQKFIVRDGAADDGVPADPAVLTGSTNFTRTGTGTNPAGGLHQQAGSNLNHVVILHGKTASSQYASEFDRLMSGTFGALHERVEPRPREFRLGHMRIKPLFAPRHGPEMEIMKQMLKARSRIDFAMFTFAQSSGIDDTMAHLAPTVPIRGVLDRGQGAHGWAATKPLQAAGVHLYQNKPHTGVRKVHHKLMVIDQRVTIAGSFNYTGPANTLNDENIIVLGDLEEDNPDAEAAQSRIAAYALQEIDRIIDDLSEPLPAL